MRWMFTGLVAITVVGAGCTRQVGSAPGRACDATGPAVLASGLGNSSDIAVDATGVYFTNLGTLEGNFLDGSVMKVPRCGDAPITLASGQARPQSLAVDASGVYWVDNGPAADGVGGAVMMAPLGGGPVTTLAEEGGFDLALDATNVYWTTGSRHGVGTVKRLPKQGGPSTILASGAWVSASIALDDTYVYWTTSTGIQKVPVEGGKAMTVTPASLLGGGDLAVDATGAYWTDGGQVLSVSLTGGRVTQVSAQAQGAQGLALDAQAVYWTGFEGASAGMFVVNKTPLAGGETTTLASGQNDVVNVAVDGTAVYWTTGDAVMRAALQ